jgi:hypothetical protein
MKGAILALLVALALWWTLEPCWDWTDSGLEMCTGITLEESLQ